MKKIALVSSVMLFSFMQLSAQVARAIVVEHFTNTRCSVCASRNPGFYANLKEEKGALHIAYHPSSPYAACLLNRHNTSENDARTRFYGVYGATPRIVIQGMVISGNSDYDNQALFASFRNQTTPLTITTSLTDKGDSIQVTVVVKTIAAHSFDSLAVHAAAAEQELIYQAPNGEALHHDVFRQNFWSTEGIPFSPATVVGDSVVLSKAILKRSEWNLSQLYALAMVQQPNKQVEQAARSVTIQPSTGLSVLSPDDIQVYPNPSYGYISVALKDTQPTSILITDITGTLCFQTSVTATTALNLSDLKAGIYFVKATNASGTYYTKMNLIQ